MASLQQRLQEFIRQLGITQSNPNDLNYDDEYESGTQTGVQQLTGLAGQLDLANAQDETERLRRTSQLDTQRGRTLEQLQARLADQGILRGGANIAKQSEIGEDYQRSSDDLSNTFRRYREGREQEFLGQQGEFQNQYSKLIRGRAGRLSERERQRIERESQLKAEQERVRQETARLQQEQVQREQALTPPPMEPTGQIQLSSGYTVPDSWINDIRNNPKLSNIYGAPYSPTGADNFGKEYTWEDQSVPYWKKIGFGSEEEYLRTQNPYTNNYNQAPPRNNREAIRRRFGRVTSSPGGMERY